MQMSVEAEIETYGCSLREVREPKSSEELKRPCSLCGINHVRRIYILSSDSAAALRQIIRFIPRATIVGNADFELGCCYSCTSNIMKNLVSRVTMSPVITREELAMLQGINRNPIREE